jgi:hypothetical protein
MLAVRGHGVLGQRSPQPRRPQRGLAWHVVPAARRALAPRRGTRCPLRGLAHAQCPRRGLRGERSVLARLAACTASPASPVAWHDQQASGSPVPCVTQPHALRGSPVLGRCPCTVVRDPRV